MIKDAMIDPAAFVAPSADVLVQVTLAAECGVFFHATLRADLAEITVGHGSNIQDNAVVHVATGYPVFIGEGVSVGHSAILHGCTVGDNTLIGMGAILLNGAVIGKNCIVGAGALITQNTVVPDNTLMLGSPAKPVRTLHPEEVEQNRQNARIKEIVSIRAVVHIAVCVFLLDLRYHGVVGIH